ncbi:GNAT family N-acetyltransferase [uncultured Helicobacter sp.]
MQIAKGFYEKFGFESVGEEFLEDGIWHIIKMIKRGGN